MLSKINALDQSGVKIANCKVRLNVTSRGVVELW